MRINKVTNGKWGESARLTTPTTWAGPAHAQSVGHVSAKSVFCCCLVASQLFLNLIALGQLWIMFQQAITNFKINYDVYNESRSFFSGDRVTGNISFELTKEIKISTISMEFRGMAHVHWSSGGGGKKRRRRHYSAKLDYFRIKSSILQDSGGMRAPQQSCALNFWWGHVWSASSCSSSWRTQTSAWHACLSVHTSDPARVCTSMLLWSCVLFLTQAWLLCVVECW